MINSKIDHFELEDITECGLCGGEFKGDPIHGNQMVYTSPEGQKIDLNHLSPMLLNARPTATAAWGAM